MLMVSQMASFLSVGKLPRIVSLSAPVLGKTSWNLNTDGDLIQSTVAGTTASLTITPTSSFSIAFSFWGDAGGNSGGRGGYVSGSYIATANVPLLLRLGLGRGSSPRGSDYNGGGLTGLFLNSVSQANALAIAAGGGGIGSSFGGAGGGLTGQAGSGTVAPTGGTQSAGGIVYNWPTSPESSGASNGSALQGGGGGYIDERSYPSDGSWNHGGGGGSGYWGGGGGPAGGSYCGGGGGGSSFLNALIQSGINELGGGLSDPKRASIGGNPATGQPGNGRAVFY